MMAAEATRSGVTLAWLLEGFGTAAGIADVEITGLQSDSRQVGPGDVFMACQGLQVHAMKHAAQAVAQGAVAVLWEPGDDVSLDKLVQALPVPAVRLPGLGQKLGLLADRFYAAPTQALHVIGVTGTDGKTSVTHFVAQALSDEGQSCGLLGTLGYGVYGDLRTPTHTTPDALTLQAEFARMRDAGIAQVAMEVSSHALHQHRTDGVMFNTAVLTHLSRDHLDYHGHIEAYAEAKRRLFTMPGLETAVLNVGDGFGRQLAAQLQQRVAVIAYGRTADKPSSYASQWLELVEVTPGPAGITLSLESSFGDAHFEAPLLGGFNADNLLAALGALLASGQSLQVAVQRLARVSTVPGRMELFSQSGGPACVVDYAHTAHALETALQALRAHCRGELVCVFGAGGDRDQGKRSKMGAVAERYADHVVLTSDNPRSEQPEAIIDQIAAGFSESARVQRILDRGEAIDAVIADAAPDDLILVAGKGHEDYQLAGGQRLAFSDRLRVQQALRRRAG